MCTECTVDFAGDLVFSSGQRGKESPHKLISQSEADFNIHFAHFRFNLKKKLHLLVPLQRIKSAGLLHRNTEIG